MTVTRPVICPRQGTPFSMSSSHTLDALNVTFDDDHLIADAGSIQPATLAQHLGLRDLFDTHVDFGDAAGHANVGHKAMTVIHSALAGGDSIDDCDTLRAGAARVVLGHTVVARRRSGRSCGRSPGDTPASSTRPALCCWPERGPPVPDPANDR